MKKTVKKLVLAKETVRVLERRDDLRHAAGGLLYAARQVTVDSGCNFCDTCCDCCTCNC